MNLPSSTRIQYPILRDSLYFHTISGTKNVDRANSIIHWFDKAVNDPSAAPLTVKTAVDLLVKILGRDMKLFRQCKNDIQDVLKTVGNNEHDKRIYEALYHMNGIVITGAVFNTSAFTVEFYTTTIKAVQFLSTCMPDARWKETYSAMNYAELKKYTTPFLLIFKIHGYPSTVAGKEIVINYADDFICKIINVLNDYDFLMRNELMSYAESISYIPEQSMNTLNIVIQEIMKAYQMRVDSFKP